MTSAQARSKQASIRLRLPRARPQPSKRLAPLESALSGTYPAPPPFVAHRRATHPPCRALRALAPTAPCSRAVARQRHQLLTSSLLLLASPTHLPHPTSQGTTTAALRPRLPPEPPSTCTLTRRTALRQPSGLGAQQLELQSAHLVGCSGQCEPTPPC